MPGKEKRTRKLLLHRKGLNRKHLAESTMMDITRILSFWRETPAPTNDNFKEENVLSNLVKSSQQQRYIPKSPDRTLDAPELIDDYYMNLLDWSTRNNLAIALKNIVYMWNASNVSSLELLTVDEENGPVTSISWAPGGQHIAVGLNSSVVDLWDTTGNQKLTTLQGGHQGRVGSLSWNNHILTTGGSDSLIVNNDVRMRSHTVHTYRGHCQEVCGLKWSNSSQHLAGGGNDNLLYIWERSMASSNPSAKWLHRFDHHKAVVKAIAWCDQFQNNLLASGGGGGDRCIKFWNINTGICLNSIDMGSQVSSLLWSKNKEGTVEFSCHYAKPTYLVEVPIDG